MINFRYHIVSLVAVFLALSVGIVTGVSLRPSVDEGLAAQAEKDRQTVQDLRTQLDRANALADYRDAYAEQVGPVVTAGVLSTYSVAVVAMPDAASGVVDSITTAIDEAGGRLSSVSRIDADAFDATQAEAVDQALSAYVTELGITDEMSESTKVGLALGRAVGTTSPGEADPVADALRTGLNAAGLVTVDARSDQLAQLVVVVTAAATVPVTAAEVATAHQELQLALAGRASGVVVAGPNSETGLEGTDVAAVRGNGAASDVLSTVDVADLPSGVSTVVLAGKEQLLGRQGQYGALSGSDAPAPDLPVR